MTLAEITRSRTRRSRSATDVMRSLGVLYWVRFGVCLVYCVLLIVLR